MYKLLTVDPESFIPFFAIFFTFLLPILAIYFYYKNKNRIMDERKLMIEKGLTPPPLNERFQSTSNKTSLNKGLNMIAIALGLLVGYFISKQTDIKIPFSITGAILFFLGIVNILSAFLEKQDDQIQ